MALKSTNQTKKLPPHGFPTTPPRTSRYSPHTCHFPPSPQHNKSRLVSSPVLWFPLVCFSRSDQQSSVKFRKLRVCSVSSSLSLSGKEEEFGNMVCLGRVLAVSYPVKPLCGSTPPHCRFVYGNRRLNTRWRSFSMAADSESSPFASAVDSDSTTDKNTTGFCIIEGPETVQDFAKMELQEIQDNIRSRRNKIFLHMEEVRRLRIQQRIKSAELADKQENELPNFPSFIPFLPPLSAANLKVYYATCFSLISGIILFGGLIAPALELKLGIGGTSYADFIRTMHLPMQLSDVDPIVASFSGGAVGVISALMVVEVNNVKLQEHKRCKYCLGTGYLACARCSSTGALVLIEQVSTTNGGDRPLSTPKTERCSNCSGSGKVMCPTCLCTGMAMASEHDPRIDPFD